MHTRELLSFGFDPKFITPEFLASQGWSATLPWRFIAKVRKTDGCWLWTAACACGYGALSNGHRPNHLVYAHRASWIMHFGPPPQDKPYVLHDCDNRPCIRPDHLWCGTHADNMADMARKGRAKLRGTRHWKNVLGEGQVREIRARYSPGIVTQQALADAYGVTRAEISHILRGAAWAWLS